MFDTYTDTIKVGPCKEIFSDISDPVLLDEFKSDNWICADVPEFYLLNNV